MRRFLQIVLFGSMFALLLFLASCSTASPANLNDDEGSTTGSADYSDVVGEWVFTKFTNRDWGLEGNHIVFYVQDGKLKGQLEPFEVEDVSYSGGIIHFKVKAIISGFPFILDLDGNVSGNVMSGTAKYYINGALVDPSIEWEAKRVE